MALVFRLNVISKRLTNVYFSFTNHFFHPSLSRRHLFTNSCSVYFAKKKVDEVRIPKCPDFEQFFTKEKKDNKNTEMLGKREDDKRKPLTKTPIFGEMKVSPQPRAEKKLSIVSPTKGKGGNVLPTFDEKKESVPQPSPDKVEPIKSPQVVDRKEFLKKSLDFTQFTFLKRVPDMREVLTESTKKPNVSSHNSRLVDGKTAKSERGESSIVSTDTTTSDKNKYFWLAATAVGICAIGLAFSMKKSNSFEPSVEPKEIIAAGTVKDNGTIVGPLALPEKVPYLIIGGGSASWSAFSAIKAHVPNAKILVVSNETHPPYMRSPLSKDLWFSGNGSTEQKVERNIFFEPSDFYSDPMQFLSEQNGGVYLLNNRTAKYLKLCERKVVLDDGTEIEYDECLIAAGTKPRNLVVFQTAPLRIRKKISFLRNLNDFQSIKEIVDKSESIAVIGGGFRATELALALTKYASTTKKQKVYQIFHENGNMGATLPRYLSDWIKKRLAEYGLFLLSSTQVESVNMEKSKLKLGLLNGQIAVVDHIIVALGSQPDIAFAKMSGLKLGIQNCGFVVNEHLEALPHLYVAGDAVCLSGNVGNETETTYDRAMASGRLAGENMVGKRKCFTHQSMFSSNVEPEISFESVGLIDSALKTIGVFANGSDFKTNSNTTNKGVVFYIKNDKVVGILLWNILNKINIARQVISEGKKLYDLNEVAQRFEIQE